MRFAAALAAGNGPVACSLATPTAKANLLRGARAQFGSCAGVIKVIADHLPASVKEGLQTLEVRKVTVRGNRATVSGADVTSSRGQLDGFISPRSPPTQFAKQPAGNWKVTG